MVRIGLEAPRETLAEHLAGRRFALLMNQASVDRSWAYACDRLAALFPGQLRALFTPQHGLFSEQQANMVESPHGRHPRLGLPVYSLYAEARWPPAEALEGIDTLVVDLQDVGTRVYTFIWTVSYCLEVCGRLQIPIVILDRPNPLGGVRAEGPLLDPACASFVGRTSIPMRHGLTLGELVRLVNAQLACRAEVRVVPVEGWRRAALWPELHRDWLLPSPNLPRFEGVLAYPGQVLLEGTNLSEGRGTTTPFEVCGAPYVDPFELADALARLQLPGIVFRPLRFTPTFDKWHGESCGGVMLHITDRNRFRPWLTSTSLLACVAGLWPREFRWLGPPYEYETVLPPIDIISGSPRLREGLVTPTVPQAPWNSLDDLDEDAWWRTVEPVRLYA